MLVIDHDLIEIVILQHILEFLLEVLEFSPISWGGFDLICSDPVTVEVTVTFVLDKILVLIAPAFNFSFPDDLLDLGEEDTDLLLLVASSCGR